MKNFKKILLGLVFTVGTIFSSNLYAATTEEKIVGLYIAFFNRAADKIGLEYWKAQANTLGEAEALKTLAAGFASHPKFASLYDALDNEAFVKAIYLNTLGKEGDAEGIQYWSELLDGGMTRSGMVAEFVSASLGFDASDPKYDSFRNVQDSSQNANTLQTAQERQDLLVNKVAIALRFIELFKEFTNLDETTDPFDLESLNLDQTYKASIFLLENITESTTTREEIEALMQELSTRPSIAIRVLNRLRLQYGSLSQGSETVETIRSLVENLEGFSFDTIVSELTGRVWMDRNLGASTSCEYTGDQACYGDYYQWGRYPDGHEKSGSSITLRVSDTYFPNDGKVVIDDSDWIDLDAKGTYREATWNVCPTGFRIPTNEELLAEKLSKNADLFKLAFAGNRDDDGMMQEKGSAGYLLSTTPTSLGLSKIAKYNENFDTTSIAKRTVSAPIRCMQVVEPISWRVSDWSSCAGACGSEVGTQSRTVTCEDAQGNQLSDSYCTEAKPELSQMCSIAEPTECEATNTFATCSIGESLSQVGYYDMSDGAGDASQVPSIEDAGLTAVKLFTLQSAELDTVEMLFVQNPSNDDYGSEYTSRLGDITTYVANGGVLLLHDRRVTEAATMIPGGGSIVFHRISGDVREIEIIDDNLETGLGGTIDDNSLDGFGYSNHGYAELSSLPAGAEVLMNNGTSNEIVTFSYPYSMGRVIYSTIPLDAHIGNASMKAYATNLVEDVAGTSSTVQLKFISSANVSVNENQTDAITLEATQGCTLTYSIEGGDSASFDVNGTTGVVTFKTTPDYETKDSYTFTAKASDGQGSEVTQEVTITILDVLEQIIHNGITYGEVLSPFTGKTWLDRNIGASQVCTALDDTDCYGDYFQWGRNADGHEDASSGEVTTQAGDVDNVGHDDFIKGSSDWASVDGTGVTRAANWSKTDGTSVCPVGYRVPTITELRDETVDASTAVVNNADAYNNFLKLPSAGRRGDFVGSVHSQGSGGILWSSSVSGSYSQGLDFNGIGASTGSTLRASGFSLRCLKD